MADRRNDATKRKRHLRDCDCYQAMAQRDAPLLRNYALRYEKTLDFIQQEYGLILDIGAARGLFSSFLSEKFPRTRIMIGDLEPGPQERENLVPVGVPDMNSGVLPFPENHFDAVLALEIIEHLGNPDHFLRECRRVVKPGGHLYLSTPNLTSWYNRLLMTFGYFPRDLHISYESRSLGLRDVFSHKPRPDDFAETHIRLYTLGVLKVLFKIHGFRAMRAQRFCGSQSDVRGKTVLNLINRMLGLIPPLANVIIVQGEKVERTPS